MFDSFVETAAAERNDYANALRVAIATLKADAALKGYVITPDDLKRGTEYNAAGAFKGLDKQLKGTTHKTAYRVVKGKADGVACVALVKTA